MRIAIIGTGETGRMVAVAIILAEIPLIIPSIPLVEHREEIIFDQLRKDDREEIVMKFTNPYGTHEELSLEESELFTLTLKKKKTGTKELKYPLHCGSTQKFNEKQTRHPP